MKKLLSIILVILMVVMLMPVSAMAYEGDDRIYTVATAHLDTVWNWPLETTISEYLPKTFNENFDLFEKYPEYVFNFEGAYRYSLIEEYYPEAFEKIKGYVADEKWYPTGSAWENGDVNTPSAEALFRNILYGNEYYQENFNMRSTDIYLPDCFGFGYALPSVMAHSNLTGFSTQKLTWGYNGPYGNNTPPFDLGIWKGVDGSQVYASLNEGDYGAKFDSGSIGANPRTATSLLNKLNNNKTKYDLPWTIRFHGTGDTGGSPGETSVSNVVNALRLNDTNSIDVLSAKADQVFKDMENLLSAEQKAKLPVHDDELLLTEHAAGAYTSRTLSKRWNRFNEQMADATERANVASAWLGSTKYPQEKLDEVWKNVINHQFHDDIPGTSILSVYNRTWNDYWMDMNQFAEEYENGVGGVAGQMNTSSVQGIPIIVNNAVEVERTDPVEITVNLKDAENIKVFDAQGTEVPSQMISKNGDSIKLVFIAKVPSMGYSVYDVRSSTTASAINTGLSISNNILENGNYKVTVDANGDISSVYDKKLSKELLSGPIRTQLINNIGDDTWGSWELHYSDIIKTPYTYASNPEFKIVENGPARVTLEVKRSAANAASIFRQYISLSSEGDIVDVYNETGFFDKTTLIKHSFELAASNPIATYDLGLGTIERGNNSDKLYEVPGRNFADLTNTDNSFGVSILSDSKYGWDKPSNNNIRLTAAYTPRTDYQASHVQSQQDFGENRYSYAIYGHSGNYVAGKTQIAGAKYNQPLEAFEVTKHSGNLGTNYSFGSIDNNNVLIRAIKKAQNSDEIIVRVNEGSGTAQTNVKLTLGEGIESAREVYASEESIGPATVSDGKLVFDIGRFSPKTFAVTLKSPTATGSKNSQLSINLPFNKDVISSNENRADGKLTSAGDAIPAELIDDTITSGGVDFAIGSKEDGQNNAVSALGQEIEIPAGYNKLYFLSTSLSKDRDFIVNVDGQKVNSKTFDYKEKPAIWDMYALGQLGKIKDDSRIAKVFTHSHTGTKDNIAKEVYIFKNEIDIPETGAKVKLPVDSNIVIMSATAVKESPISAVSQLLETKEPKEFESEPAVKNTVAWETDVESGSPQPINRSNGNTGNVTNASVSASTEQAHSGTHSVKVVGNDNSTSSSFYYWNAFDDVTVQLTENSVLRFWLYANNDLGRHVSIDLYQGATWLCRDEAAIVSIGDSYTTGVRNHASAAKGEVGEWTFYEFPLAQTKVRNALVDRVVINYDYGASTGQFVAYLDDIYIGPADGNTEPPPPPEYRELWTGLEDEDELNLPFNETLTTNIVQVTESVCERISDAKYQGEKGIYVTGMDDRAASGSGISHVYYQAFTNVDLPIVDREQTLTYMVKPMNELGRFVGLDIQFTDGTVMRDTSTCTDQEGIGMHPSRGRGTVGEWSVVSANLGMFKGKTVGTIYVVYDHPADTGQFETYIDNISIKKVDSGSAFNSRTLLGEIIAAAKLIDTEEYSEVTATALANAIIDAERVYNDEEADENSILGAIESVRNAVWGLAKDGEDPDPDPEPKILSAASSKANYDLGEKVVLTVETESIDKIRLFNTNGIGMIATKTTKTESEGITTWILETSISTKGNKDIIVKGYKDGVEADSKTVNVKIAVTPDQEILPTLTEASTDKTSYKTNETIKVTVVTSTAVSNVMLSNEAGKAMAKKSSAFSDVGSVRTWTIETAISTKGTRTITAVAAAADKVFDEAYGVVEMILNITK